MINYPFVRKLNASYNPKVKNVNHLSKLQILNANWDCGIDDLGIKNLNLIELNAYHNPKIKNVNHMTKLQKLNARGKSGIDDSGINNLNLIELDAYNNPKITKKIGTS